MFITLNVRWDSRLRSCYSLSANIFWSCVGLDYLAFLFVPTAANPSLSFHFLSFNMEHFLCLILVLLPFPFSLLPSLSLRHVIKYLKWRKGCLTSNTQSLFFILLLPVSATRHTGPFFSWGELSLPLCLSFFLSFSIFSFGSGSIWCDRRLFCLCLHIILLQNESENLCLLCMKTILLEPFSLQVQCVLRISQTRLNYDRGRHIKNLKLFLLPFSCISNI